MRGVASVLIGLVLILTHGCSDDNGNGDPDLAVADQSSVTDNGPTTDKGPATDNGPTNDKGPPADNGPSPDQGPLPDLGDTDAFTKSNSGAICTVSNPTCPSPEEKCTFFDVSTGKGMCLGKCANQGDGCPVANPNTQMSVCATKGLDGKWYCSWFCKLGGKSYQCPNTTDYTCEAKSGEEFCRPK